MKHLIPAQIKRFLNVIPFNLFVWILLALYLSPVMFMMVTAMMPTSQIDDENAPLYPAKIQQVEYEGKEYQVYNVPMDGETKPMVLVVTGGESSKLLDPEHPENGLVTWKGNWRTLVGVYEFHPTWENFTVLFKSLPFPRMLRNTLLLTLVGEFAVVVSSILVAYGFSRFKIPGGNFLFYVLIATILIPDKVTFIPKFFLYATVLEWRGTVYPVLLHLFFGNAVYIFLLRQNFKSIPVELEEAAMLDGAGPLRRLFMVVLPQSWPVVITVSLLHFFYTWNETRLASLYLAPDRNLMPVSFGVQNYQSLLPIQNVISASTVIVLIVPVIVLFLAQKYFMQGLVITGAEAAK
jgi:multiple sugar transport system permease protein